MLDLFLGFCFVVANVNEGSGKFERIEIGMSEEEIAKIIRRPSDSTLVFGAGRLEVFQFRKEAEVWQRLSIWVVFDNAGRVVGATMFGPFGQARK